MRVSAKVTLADVAKRAGVSLTCVSRVLNDSGYVAQDKKKRVIQALQELEYVHKDRSHRRSNLIAVVLPNVSNLLFQTVLNSFSAEAQRRGKLILTYTDIMENESLPGVFRRLLMESIDGIVITNFWSQEMSPQVSELISSSRVPVVLLDRDGGCQFANKILTNNLDGTYLATEYLIRIGHRRIAYVGFIADREVERQRLAGYTKAMEKYKLPVERAMIALQPEYTAEHGRSAMHSILSAGCGVTALVTGADCYVCGALYALSERGLSVPKDISIIGYDNELAAYLAPAVTSVEPPFVDMAAIALDIIEENLEGSPAYRTVYLSPKLVHRDSTMPL